jgi:hypothetical protein
MTSNELIFLQISELFGVNNATLYNFCPNLRNLIMIIGRQIIIESKVETGKEALEKFAQQKNFNKCKNDKPTSMSPSGSKPGAPPEGGEVPFPPPDTPFTA